ncbi:MAG: hypothetical protein KAJ19_20725 [Gammaproteobacteria bacterium]|nr:hypothetical protein [Gammaproteobacteria bacterium]
MGDRFTANFQGLNQRIEVLSPGEFESRALDKWMAHVEGEGAKQVCSQAFLGSTLPCECGGRVRFESVDVDHEGHEDWNFQCPACARSWKLINVKVMFSKE